MKEPSEPSLVKGGQGELTLKGQNGGVEFETRRSSLTPIVRSYADRLYASIKKIYAKYGVSSVAEMHAKVASGDKPRNLKPGELKSDSTELAKLVENLKSALENDAIPEGEPEREGFVLLRDVPTLEDGLPSAATLKDKANGYKFDWIWEAEYRAGRPASDFALTEGDLETIGFDDPRKRRELLEGMAEASGSKEPERPAKVFDINETIAEKKKEDPDHPDWLTTKEVLEAMDAAGCRPATLGELLAFGKEHWKPDADAKFLTDEEKTLQRVAAPYIYALGSPFTDSDGDRRVPFLRWHGSERSLGDRGFGDDWGGGLRFLVLRKPSS